MTAPAFALVDQAPVDPDDQVDALDPADPDAPYGRKPDGRPYTMPESERAEIGERLRAAKAAKAAGYTRRTAPPPRQTRRTAAPPPRKSGPGAPSTPPKVTAPLQRDYRPALTSLLALPMALLATLGRTNKAFALDAVALTIHTPDIVQATQEAAEADARLAGVLDRLLAVSPYGALFAAFAPLALQIAHNHGAAPAVPELGVFTEDQLLAELERRTHGG